MFFIEIFDGTDWKRASAHSLQVDAQMQVERFRRDGSAEEDLRIIEDIQAG